MPSTPKKAFTPRKKATPKVNKGPADLVSTPPFTFSLPESASPTRRRAHSSIDDDSDASRAPTPIDFFSSARRNGSTDTIKHPSAAQPSLTPSSSYEAGFETAAELLSSISSVEATPVRKRKRSGETSGSSQNIKVIVRVKPQTKASSHPTWILQDTSLKLSPSDHRVKSKGSNVSPDAYTYHYNSVLPPTGTTQQLYENDVAPVVQACLEGFNATIFAYGQTASGKTHTMMGTEEEIGIIPHAIEELFHHIKQDSSQEYLLRVSYIEIYNEQLKDLLNRNTAAKLEIRDSDKGIHVDHLQLRTVVSSADIYKALEEGHANREVAATDWNAHSSRSHSVFSIKIESGPKADSLMRSDLTESRIRVLNLIDLAGSEKASSGAGAERNAEGAFINKSLHTLGQVIDKLSSSARNKGHIPWRNSKLTRLLQTSLGGNARIAIIATISGDSEHVSESLSTLAFAGNAIKIVTKAQIGIVDGDGPQLQIMQNKLLEMQAELDRKDRLIAEANANALNRSTAEREQQQQRERIDTLVEDKAKLAKELALTRSQLLTGSEPGNGRYPSSLSMTAGAPGSQERQSYYRRVSALTTPQKAATPIQSRIVSTIAEGTADEEGSTSAETATMISKELRLQLRSRTDEVKRLEALVAEKDATNASALSELSKELARIVIERDAAISKEHATRKQAEADVKKLEKGIKIKVGECQKLSAKMDATIQLLKGTQEERDQVREQKAVLELSLTDNQRTFSALQDEAQILKQQASEEAERCQQLNSENANLKASLAKKQTSYETIEDTVVELRAELSATKATVRDTESQLAKVQERVRVLERDIDTLQTQKANLECEITRIRELRKPQLPATPFGPTANDLAARVASLSTSRSASGDKQKANEALITHLQTTVADLQKRLAEAERIHRPYPGSIAERTTSLTEHPASPSSQTFNVAKDIETNEYRQQLAQSLRETALAKEDAMTLQRELSDQRERNREQALKMSSLERERLTAHDFPTSGAKPFLYSEAQTRRPLALDYSNASPTNSPSRGSRRPTIGRDLERLEETQPVVKNKASLLTPRASVAKKRILTGVDQRLARQETENLAPDNFY